MAQESMLPIKQGFFHYKNLKCKLFHELWLTKPQNYLCYNYTIQAPQSLPIEECHIYMKIFGQ